MIRSSWKWKDKLFLWKITIPADCKGEVVLPIKGFSLLTINGKASKRLEKILFLNPGTYEIEIKK